MWGRVLIGNNGTCPTLCWFSVTPSAPHNQIGPFWCCSLSGWVCVQSRPLWVSPRNSPVRLGVSPATASTPTGVFTQRFEALFPHAGTLGCMVCFTSPPALPVYLRSNMGSRGLPATTLPTQVIELLPCHESSPPGCPSPPLLLVWMNISSLTPWLSDFYTG